MSELLGERIKGKIDLGRADQKRRILKAANEIVGRTDGDNSSGSLSMNRRSGELTHHLDCERNSSSGNNSGNSRNGKSGKSSKDTLKQSVWKFLRSFSVKDKSGYPGIPKASIRSCALVLFAVLYFLGYFPLGRFAVTFDPCYGVFLFLTTFSRTLHKTLTTDI
ncbi:hypothetical protein CLV95_13214 [Leptospira borgpetersenii serovar Javanica]|nr:hypothetical protein CLV95_13214 [Leptospira borgpetersenii serovar Javanica]